jgi:hypothetical protein
MALQMVARASQAMDRAAVSRMDLELSMATTTWYCRLLGLVRRSQILSLRNWLAMYGMICHPP